MTPEDINLVAGRSRSFGPLSTAASLVTTLDACNQIKACVLEIRAHLQAMGDNVPFQQACDIADISTALAYMEYIAGQLATPIQEELKPTEPPYIPPVIEPEPEPVPEPTPEEPSEPTP